MSERWSQQPVSSPITIPDSGYASLAGTPESDNTCKPQDCLASGTFICPRRKLFQRVPTLLKQFDEEPPTVIKDRFDDLSELFERPLYDYLVKTKIRWSSVAMRLRLLGESEESARPWIIILCDAVIVKKVKQFFQLRWVKAEYQPNTVENNLPYFDIHYIGRAPKQRAAGAYYSSCKQSFADHRAQETLCGRAITVMGPNGPRMATLGGVVAIENSQGNFELYGMTAGHVLSVPSISEEEAWIAPPISGLEDEDGDEDEPDIYIEGVNQFDVDFEDSIDADRKGLFAYDPPDSTGPPHLLRKLGDFYASSCSAEDHACNLDWALITIEDSSQYLPNQFTDATRLHAISNRIYVNTQEAASSRRAVVQLSDGSFHRQGYLSLARSTHVMLAPANKFTKVYILSLSDGSGLKPGECGSWIVDIETDEVYGHVIASDAFGDAYVVPFNATLASMKQHMAATAAFLPSAHEVEVARRTASKSHDYPEHYLYPELVSNNKATTLEVRPLENSESSDHMGNYTVLQQMDDPTASNQVEDPIFPAETDHLITPSDLDDTPNPGQIEIFVELRKSLYDLASNVTIDNVTTQEPRRASGKAESPLGLPKVLCHPDYKKFQYFGDAAPDNSVTLQPGRRRLEPIMLQVKGRSVPEQLRELLPDSGYSSAPPTPEEGSVEITVMAQAMGGAGSLS